ncbi:uncharacterized protein PAC_14125 [Phialocephala subalpina]|uniref:2EXR domain-containing protein n=1 Tax=Phialocephala subalpina TaxID=576137 RepID=A0A1L7XH02_9HELO|nr:uncharacterized protein PAC_14125 [Phialocephala subalpina]
MGNLINAMARTDSGAQSNDPVKENDNDSTESLTASPNQPIMAAEIYMQKVQQLAQLSRDAQVLTESLQAVTAQALGTSSVTRVLDTFVKQGSEYAKLDRFTLFPKLPIELRIKIWREAMPSPRVESRTEALKKYNWKPDTISYLSYDWIDPAEDTVYLAPSAYEDLNLFDYISCLAVTVVNIQHLAMDSCFWVDAMAQPLIKRFTGLKSFTMIMKCERHYCVEEHDPRGLEPKEYEQHVIEAKKGGIQFVLPLLQVKILEAFECGLCEQESGVDSEFDF